MPPPAWLSADAPQSDVVLSSRCRVMRNLTGFRFPHHAKNEELKAVQSQVLRACSPLQPGVEDLGKLTQAERDYLVGCRLISPDFEWRATGRSVLLDQNRILSLMVNEEDHVRLQALTAGYSFEHAESVANQTLRVVGEGLDFAWSPRFGYLAASPYNAGEGRRLSTMLHLIGLGHTQRLPSMIKAAGAHRVIVRGLFGESSRAIGAFVQVSVTGGTRAEFVGACDYLIKAERAARLEVERSVVEDRAKRAIEFVIASPALTLAHALRVLGWMRWAACQEIAGIPFNHRDVDGWLTALEIRNTHDEDKASRQRADYLRARLDP